MINHMKSRLLSVAGLIILFLTASSFEVNPPYKIYFPFREAGLNERQAAAHLLSRFTFGTKPGDVDKVVSIGLEKWFQQQLEGKISDSELNERLKSFDLLNLTNQQVVAQIPSDQQIRQKAIAEGFISKDSLEKGNKKNVRKRMDDYRQMKGFRQDKDLQTQFFSQKILRAAMSANQLHQVLTDFWFNHFNVSMTKNQCARFIPAYERDAIRPHVTGDFEELLFATAKSPAMLLYLDNSSSVGENAQLEQKLVSQKQKIRGVRRKRNGQSSEPTPQPKKNQGLNENYAREVMELHTLGVDGGYTQKDVTEAARVLTGWTVFPMLKSMQMANVMEELEKRRSEKLTRQGFVHDGDFLFAANRHDSNPKTILGENFSSGDYQEGVKLLKLLAHHPSTAKFISAKLAIHFVSDNPPQLLVDKMAKAFLEKDGNISDVLTTMVSAPEFWREESLRSKIKSPFEYAIGAVRSLNGNIQNAMPMYQWITRMGQKLYYYQAPTGFPDRGQYWINTGSLLNRMNFGLAISSGRVGGVVFDLAALNDHHEPESAVAALPVYAKILLPERNLETTIKRLTPLITEPDIGRTIDRASSKRDTANKAMDAMEPGVKQKRAKQKAAFENHQMLAQVVGIIIGSPEFQRR